MQQTNQPGILYTPAKTITGKLERLILLLVFIASSLIGDVTAFNSAAIYYLPLFFVVFAFYLILTGRVKHTEKTYRRLFLAGILIAAFSLLGAFLSFDFNSFAYTLLFLFTWASICIALHRINLGSMLRLYAFAGTSFALIYLVASGFNIQGALAIDQFGGGDFERFEGPFNTNPNLISHMAASFAIVCFWQARSERWLLRLVFYAASATCLTLGLSTSSRGGLFAGLGAIFISFAVFTWNTRHFYKGLAVAALIVGVALFRNPDLFSYLANVLQFDSQYRGVNSGFTGRTELWAKVYGEFFTFNIPIIWGGGMRNEWLANFTSAVDNGYLVVLAENGIVPLLIFIFLIFYCARTAFRRRKNRNTVDAAIFALCIFIALESVVARYLLAIGNPASFLILIVLIGYSADALKQRRQDRQRRRAMREAFV